MSNLVPKLICFRSVIEISNNNTILAEDTGEAFPDPQKATEPVETPAGDLIVFEETESCVKSSSDSEERESPATGRKESPKQNEVLTHAVNHQKYEHTSVHMTVL